MHATLPLLAATDRLSRAAPTLIDHLAGQSWLPLQPVLCSLPCERRA